MGNSLFSWDTLYLLFFCQSEKHSDTFRANICNFDKKVLTKILKFMQHRLRKE